MRTFERSDSAHQTIAGHSTPAPVPELAPGTHAADSVLRLQRTIGNRAVGDLIRADAGAEVSSVEHHPYNLARSLAMQARSEPSAAANPMGALDGLAQAGAGEGHAVPQALRSRIEDATGADLSGVRIHTGSEAQRAARMLNARAFTIGRDIHFGQGEYRPGDQEGDRLIAHEIVHTIQQGPGAVTGVQPQLEVSQPGDPAEVEAEAIANTIIDSKAGADAPTPMPTGSARNVAAVQRREIPSGVEQAALEDLEAHHGAPLSDAAAQRWYATARADKDEKHHNFTITNPNYVGGYENVGANKEIPTIHVGAKALAAGGARLDQLEADYRAYAPSLRATLKAMGRLKDLDNAGAKTDPAALLHDPKLKSKFHLDASRGGDRDFNAWSAQVNDERLAVRNLEPGFQQLQAAISGFRAAQNMLKRRQKGGELEDAKAKKEKIDETVETLEKIIETSKKAYEGMEKIETFLDTTRDVKDLEAIEREESYKETRSGQQALVDAATKGYELTKKHHEKVESWLKTGGLTLENVLIFATGNDKEYEKLNNTIGKLQNDMADLGYDVESYQIKQAKEQLEGMTSEVGVRIQTATAKPGQARMAAGTFGHSMAGDEGALAMFAAQAYQDLAIFGGEADRQRRTRIDPNLGWLYNFLQDNAYPALGNGWKDDWDVLQAWGQDLVEQREFFSVRTPEWQAKAQAWNDFFAQLTGGGLIHD